MSPFKPNLNKEIASEIRAHCSNQSEQELANLTQRGEGACYKGFERCLCGNHKACIIATRSLNKIRAKNAKGQFDGSEAKIINDAKAQIDGYKGVLYV
jgi:hypothetical protein